MVFSKTHSCRCRRLQLRRHRRRRHHYQYRRHREYRPEHKEAASANGSCSQLLANTMSRSFATLSWQ